MDRMKTATARKEAQAAGAGANKGWRIAAVSLVALLALTVVAGVWWLAVLRLSPASSPTATTELRALDAKLTQVLAAITPIARQFTAEPASGTIDVTAYRAKIAATRELVDGVNGLEITDPGALEIRDLIVTGGSEVLAGMDAALDALVSDEASATDPAVIQVDAGLAKLQDARDALDRLLGRSSVTQRERAHRTGQPTGA